MKRSLIFSCLIIACSTASAQNKPTAVNTEEVLKRVADRILVSTSFKFTNKSTGERLTSLQGIKPTPDVVAESPYNKWGYPNGVMMTGLMHMSTLLNDQKYKDYCLHNYRFIFDNLPYFEGIYKNAVSSGGSAPVRTEFAGFFKMGNLDNCGAMAAGLSDVYVQDKRQDYCEYLDRAGNYILNEQIAVRSQGRKRYGRMTCT
jgi:unsaturated rhamnogalacturonyl hydrolase